MNSPQHFDRTKLHQSAAGSIDRKGVELLGLGTRRPLKQSAREPFPSRQKPVATITDMDMIGEPKLSYSDISGRTVARYFWENKSERGLFDGDYTYLRRLVEHVLKTKPFNFGFSHEFIEEQIFEWWKGRLCFTESRSLSEYLVESAEDALTDHHLIVPLSGIEIEHAFQIGDILVAPMDTNLIEEMKISAISRGMADPALIAARFDKMAREIGHLTGINVEIVGEARFAKSKAQSIAFQVAEMFRFMCPAALTWNIAYPCFPHGCHHHRTTSVFTLSGHKISHISEGILDTGMFTWRMSRSELDHHMKSGFENYSIFFQSGELTQFQSRVGKSIGTYSEGVGTYNTNNRLIYAMSALEHLFLRNEQEPIQSGVGERIAFLIAQTADERRNVVSNFKKAYALRSKQVHHLSTVDDESTLSQFFINAWIALRRALQLIGKFKTHIDFLDEIDNIKFSGLSQPKPAAT